MKLVASGLGPTPSAHPTPGDVCLGCPHRPRFDAHLYAFEGALIEFERPDGSYGIARWILLCDKCHMKHMDNPVGAEVDCDMLWPASATITFARPN
jgi:hypothetical protein